MYYDLTLFTDIMTFFLFFIGIISLLPFGFWVALTSKNDINEETKSSN